MLRASSRTLIDTNTSRYHQSNSGKSLRTSVLPWVMKNWRHLWRHMVTNKMISSISISLMTPIQTRATAFPTAKASKPISEPPRTSEARKKLIHLSLRSRHRLRKIESDLASSSRITISLERVTSPLKSSEVCCLLRKSNWQMRNTLS